MSIIDQIDHLDQGLRGSKVHGQSWQQLGKCSGFDRHARVELYEDCAQRSLRQHREIRDLHRRQEDHQRQYSNSLATQHKEQNVFQRAQLTSAPNAKWQSHKWR